MSRPPVQPPDYPWYDSWWLAEYARAKTLLAAARPDMLERFVERLAIFDAPAGFTARTIDDVLDDATFARIRETIRRLRPHELELHEARTFGRFVVHNHPYFSELHRALTPLVAAAAGEAVEPSYNFLSLYASGGVCAPHLDAPTAKWTLDLCVDQSAPWPIHFSQVVPWPVDAGPGPGLRYTAVSLEPRQAVLFSGSSQWHYRDPMPRAQGRQFCDLLFFHFVPAGTRELARPERWASLFGVPELSGLGDRNPKSIFIDP